MITDSPHKQIQREQFQSFGLNWGTSALSADLAGKNNRGGAVELFGRVPTIGESGHERLEQLQAKLDEEENKRKAERLKLRSARTRLSCR